MSFPPSFSLQIAAIMDVLAKAAVAEIAKLVEDEAVVLRLEVCRREGEIQELNRSLRKMEAELCRAREAAAKAGKDNQPQGMMGIHGCYAADPEDKESHAHAMHFQSKTVNALYHGGSPSDERKDLGFGRQSRPAEKCSNAGMSTVVSVNHEEKKGPGWSPGHNTSERPAHAMQPFFSHSKRYPVKNNPERSCSSATTVAASHDSLMSALIKEEPQIEAVCAGIVTPESISAEQDLHLPQLTVHDGDPTQPGPLQSGPSQIDLHTWRSTEANLPTRNTLRAKKMAILWKGSQKLSKSKASHSQHAHGASKPFKCQECGKSFTQKTRLKTHQSVHTGERPFSCQICGKLFARQDNCLRHMRFHSGLKPYCCEMCGKTFTVQSNLKIHQEIHLRAAW